MKRHRVRADGPAQKRQAHRRILVDRVRYFMSALTTRILATLVDHAEMGRPIRNALCVLISLGAVGCSGPGFWARRGAIDAVQFSPDGTLLAVGGRDAGTEPFTDHGDIKLYAPADGRLLHQIALEHRVTGMAFDSTGTWLAVTTSLSREGPDYRDTLHVFAVSDSAKPEECFAVPDSPWLRGLAFSPDSRFLAAWGRDNTIVWRTASWARELTVPGSTRAVAFDTDGTLLAVARWDPERIEVWDVPGRRKIADMPGTGPLLLHPSGRWWVFFDSQRGALAFFGIRQRQEDFVLTVPGSRCHSIALSPDDKLAAIVDEKGEAGVSAPPAGRVIVLDVRTRQIIHEFGPEFAPASAVTFVNAGRQLAISVGGAPAIVDVDSGHLLGRLSATPTAGYVVTDGTRVATHGSESVAAWNIRDASPRLLWQNRWRRLPWSPLE